MEAQQDFKELLGLFNGQKIEYIIVGAYALAYHGAPRFTGSMDIFVKPSIENARRTLPALADFGFGSLNLNIEDFQKHDSVVQLGVPPVRIQVAAKLAGTG